MFIRINELLPKSEGQGLIEYGLIISLVVVALIFTLKEFGLDAKSMFNYIAEKAGEVL